MSEGCPFCDIIDGLASATDLRRYIGVVSFIPLNPVTEGHILVVPERHVTNAIEDPDITGRTMRRAAWIIRERGIESANIITSIGGPATQTVEHLHVHIIPRREDDGLKLPWSDVESSPDLFATDPRKCEHGNVRLFCPKCMDLTDEEAEAEARRAGQLAHDASAESQDYLITYDEFWKGIVTDSTGAVDMDKIKRELHDYGTLMRSASKVYDHITLGRISKPNTNPEAVIDEFEAYLQRVIDALKEGASAASATDDAVESHLWVNGIVEGVVFCRACGCDGIAKEAEKPCPGRVA